MVIKAIIFDCFGVLVTSARVVLKKDYPQYKNQIDDLNHQADYGLISRQQFDEVILSSDVDLAKPEIAIFELMADRLGVEPNECIMIDDTALNVEAAKNAGMQGIWFVSTDTAQNEFDIILGSNYA